MAVSRFTHKYGLLLGGFLEVADLWRSYSSPLQHVALTTPSDPQSAGSRRDLLYLASLIMSIAAFVATSSTSSPTLRAVAMGTALYRASDLLVALGRIAIVGAFGSVPTYNLKRAKVMRNTLASLVNYVELTFWYAAVYVAVASQHPLEFSYTGEFFTPAFGFILSFTTLTTIGYGNVAPQGWFAAILCWMEALTALVLLSCVVGSLVSLAASGSDLELNASTSKEHPAENQMDPSRLPTRWFVWLVQRALTLGVFIAASWALLR